MQLTIHDIPPGTMVQLDTGLMAMVVTWFSDEVFDGYDNGGDKGEYRVARVVRGGLNVLHEDLEVWGQLLSIIPNRRVCTELFECTDFRGREFWRRIVPDERFTQSARDSIRSWAHCPLQQMEESLEDA